jgi:hypothetical protein
MDKSNHEMPVLNEALPVARGSKIPGMGEGEAKMVRVVLQMEDATVEISESDLWVWFSWLPRTKPSRYDKCLAPRLLQRLMELGGVEKVGKEATFLIGPQKVGTGLHSFDLERKWVRIVCEDNRITIRVRKDLNKLDDKSPLHFVIVRCQRCNGELRTPLAKQCLNCGYDWH